MHLANKCIYSFEIKQINYGFFDKLPICQKEIKDFELKIILLNMFEFYK